MNQMDSWTDGLSKLISNLQNSNAPYVTKINPKCENCTYITESIMYVYIYLPSGVMLHTRLAV